MELKEYEILMHACRELQSALTGLDVTHTSVSEPKDGEIVNLSGVRFIAYVRQHVTGSNIDSIISKALGLSNDFDCPPLIIVGYAAPAIMKQIQDRGICVLDYAGNCHIMYGTLFLSVTGRQNNFVKEKKTKALTDSAVRLIYYFLENRELISAPIREISSVTGFSIGLIKNTLDELSNRKFILSIGRKRILNRYEELLDLWVERYNELVKPKLLLKRMAFKDYECRSHWMDIKLPDGMYWGGDCGANIIDGYLVPGTFEIYSDKSSAYLMSTGKVRLDEEGEIIIYKKFWTTETNERTAPLLIVYADLMGTGDSRCIEAAKRLIKGWNLN